MFNSIAEIRKEYDAVTRTLIQRGYRYNSDTDTYYAPKGDDEGKLLCKKYKALNRVLDACYNLEELYVPALD